MHPGILGHLPAAPVSCRLIFSNPGYIPEEDGDKDFPTAGQNDEINIVYAGLIKSNRGLDLMSEWADAYTGSQKVKLHLIGRCPEPTGLLLDKLVENSQDRANLSVQIHGEIPHADVLKILRHSHIGLCPINPGVLNYQYAYPVKIIEYLGSDLIVVATRAHGICSMVSENEAGYTFNYNLESFSMAMDKAITACLDKKPGNKKMPGFNQLLESYQWHLVNERLSKDIFQIF
jgi:glycosyltransferase involved in cell wall biosynthesis